MMMNRFLCCPVLFMLVQAVAFVRGQVPAKATATPLRAFQNHGELRVAVQQYMTNESAVDAVIAMYGNISNWDVVLVDDMSGLFQNYATFNENISAWQTENVMDMSRLFFGASSFNGDLIAWKTMKVTSMRSMFQGATSFAGGDISAWSTSQVVFMGDMFRGASAFNSDISFWNVERLRDMSTMFWEATSFNADISIWNIHRVQDFNSAFLDATSFSQQLCWKLRENAQVLKMFCGTSGASIKSDCVCESNLYYDETCVNPEVVAQMNCELPVESAASGPAINGWRALFGAVALVVVI